MCYHIRWNTKDDLDWECHPSVKSAEAAARQLVLPGETYTIEKQKHETQYRSAASGSEPAS